eukprot:6212425-Pleurochrysis_carterae.AAC.2
MGKLENEHFGDSALHRPLQSIFIGRAIVIAQRFSTTNPFSPSDVVKVACICPSSCKLAPLIRRIEDRLGDTPADYGRLVFKSYTTVVKELLAQDPGVGDMPQLPFFIRGNHLFHPLVVSFDATGFGS